MEVPAQGIEGGRVRDRHVVGTLVSRKANMLPRYWIGSRTLIVICKSERSQGQFGG